MESKAHSNQTKFHVVWRWAFCRFRIGLFGEVQSGTEIGLEEENTVATMDAKSMDLKQEGSSSTKGSLFEKLHSKLPTSDFSATPNSRSQKGEIWGRRYQNQRTTAS
jgi:hypothetical protein